LYFEQIVVGIDVLQSRNILHRDLKFENILIKQGFIKIADFGLAKFLGSELEVSSRRCGTPYTMAPEIYFSDSYKTPYTTKCDIWSIGVILHEMLYQKHPFKGNR
jgi:serine/threonine protein kinase